MNEAEFVLVELWQDGLLLIERQWDEIVDDETGISSIKPRYSMIGGKVAPAELEKEAVARVVQERAGIEIDAADESLIPEAELLLDTPAKVRVFRKLLQPHITPDNSIVVCSGPTIVELGKNGKLLPYTQQYVEKEFIVKDGA